MCYAPWVTIILTTILVQSHHLHFSPLTALLESIDLLSFCTLKYLPNMLALCWCNTLFSLVFYAGLLT